MAINNDRNLLEQQILSNSGLKGKELENLKARLATLSEQQLQAELSKSLSGNNKGEWYTGVMLEHNESVVMRNNHDQTTYTDDNGNEISELKDGDEVLERTIKSTDDKGNVFKITVTFSGGRPLTQIKSKNGNTTETTTYKYNDDADIPFVTVETKKADQSKVTTNVLEVDVNGNYDNEDFIDRETTLLDGTEIFVTKENGRLTENVKKIGKPEVTTVYNGDNIQDLDSKKLNRLKQNEVYYDGKGNTYVQVNAGETAQIMADRINKKRTAGQPQVTAQQIIELNPNLVKKNGEFVLQKLDNGVKGLGEVKVPGEFDANSPFIRTRQSIQKANNLANQAEIDKQIATKVTENTDKKFAAELANNGFKPTRENAIFYNKFNALNPTQQHNVLSVIKYCKNQKITDPNKIKARILDSFPEINLFDSGKTIPQTDNNVPAFQKKNPVALETFLTETLKLDLKSESGAMVYEKLASLPQEHLNKINAQNFSDLSKANFVEIAQRLEANGIDIRSRQEHQIENNSPRMKAEQERRELRESASQNIALAYDNAINIIKQYQGNQGWINVGFYREKLGKLLSNVNPTKINTCFDDVIKELEKEKKFAVGYLKGKCTNDKEFKESFKKVSGGVEYNEANIKAFLDVAQDPKANFEDEKYNEKFWNAYNKAFGIAKTDKNGKVYYEPQVVKQATSRTNFQQYADGAGDIVLMLLGTEAIGKGVAWAGGKLISKVSPYVPKFLANAGSKTVMTIGSNNITVGRVAANMASQCASFELWDASKNYINLKTKDIQYSGKDAEKEWEAYKEGNVESAKFGAFAGALNTTVVGKVINGTMKMFEKPIAKAISKVGKSFEKTSAMSGSDVMKTFMLNQTPGALAKTAGTIAEIGGFTLYETANEVIEELLKKGEGGHLPAKLTEDGLTSYLLDKLGDQAKNLGEIKAISRLIFMHKGAIKEQARLMDENLAKCETLKNVQIKKTEINGREIFEVTMPDGSRKVANSVEEIIANCNVLMQLDVISNAAKENTNKKRLSSVETEIPDLTEALSTVAEVKVKRAWQHHDIKTSTPDEKVDLFNLDLNAGLKEPIQDIKNEVTSLVLKNKLRDALDTRFKIEDDKFNKILQSHKNEINNLAKKYSNNNQAFCQELVNILSKDFGLSEFKPTIRIVKDNELEGNGGFDSSDGTINISEKVKNINEIVEIVSHEFIHHLQYLNLVAQYREQGVKELLTQSFDFEYDNSLTDEMKTNIINERLNSQYNKKILSNFKPQNQDGTVASYINSVYKDEMTNIPTPGTPQYFAQITELEAYHIGSKNGVNLEIENHGIDELNNNNSNLEFYMHYVQELIHRNNPGAKYDRITGIKLPELPKKLQKIIRNNSEDANFDRISGLNIREQLIEFVRNNIDINEQSLFIQELIHRNHSGSKYDRFTGIKLPKLPQKLQRVIRNNPVDANFDRVSGLNIREQLVEYLKTNKASQQKENTNKRHKTVLAGYTTMSDANSKYNIDKIITKEQAKSICQDANLIKFVAKYITNKGGDVSVADLNAAVKLQKLGICETELSLILKQFHHDYKNFDYIIDELLNMIKDTNDLYIDDYGKLKSRNNIQYGILPTGLHLHTLTNLYKTEYGENIDFFKSRGVEDILRLALDLEQHYYLPESKKIDIINNAKQKSNYIKNPQMQAPQVVNNTKPNSSVEATHIDVKEIKTLITVEQARKLCNDDGLIKLVSNESGQIIKDALDVAMKYKELSGCNNDDIEFLLEQCNGNYKKVNELMARIKPELDKLDFEITNGAIGFKGLKIGESPDMDGKQFIEKYGDDIPNMRENLQHRCYRVDDLMNFYLFGKGKYIDSFNSGNIMKDFDVAYGCRSVTEGYHVRYTIIHEKEDEIASLIASSLSNQPTPIQRYALGCYKGDMSDSIQNGRMIKEGNYIEEYLSSNPLKKSIKVKREDSYAILSNLKFADGVTLKDAITNPQYYDRLSQIKSLEGQSFINDKFMSTTVGRGAFGNCDVNWDLEVGEGVGATYLDILGLASEGELLLNRGLKVTITEIEDTTPKGVVNIKAKVEKAD